MKITNSTPSTTTAIVKPITLRPATQQQVITKVKFIPSTASTKPVMVVIPKESSSSKTTSSSTLVPSISKKLNVSLPIKKKTNVTKKIPVENKKQLINISSSSSLPKVVESKTKIYGFCFAGILPKHNGTITIGMGSNSIGSPVGNKENNTLAVPGSFYYRILKKGVLKRMMLSFHTQCSQVVNNIRVELYLGKKLSNSKGATLPIFQCLKNSSTILKTTKTIDGYTFGEVKSNFSNLCVDENDYIAIQLSLPVALQEWMTTISAAIEVYDM